MISKYAEPFARTHKQEGTGLGLCVWRIVLAHNGTISYTSMPHKGTEFEILYFGCLTPLKDSFSWSPIKQQPQEKS